MRDIIDRLMNLALYLPPNGTAVLNETVMEIERLRAAQFKWNPISVKPTTDDEARAHNGLFLWLDAMGNMYFGSHVFICLSATATHWAIIPKMPEPTQEDKDESAWNAYIVTFANGGGLLRREYEAHRTAFFAGLVSARKEKV